MSKSDNKNTGGQDNSIAASLLSLFTQLTRIPAGSRKALASKLNSLPADLRLEIMENLDFKTGTSLSLVNKEFNKEWSKYVKSRIKNIVIPKKLLRQKPLLFSLEEFLFKINPNITSLDCSEIIYYLNNELLSLLIERFTKLQSLNLNNCHNITDYSLSLLGDELRNLDLTNCKRISIFGLEYLSNLKKLESLSLANCERIDDAALAHLSGLTELRNLDLSYCKKITDAGLEHLSELINMESLNLKSSSFKSPDTNITHIGLTHLKKLLKLKNLNLDAYYIASDIGFIFLSRFTDLENLSITGGSELNRRPNRMTNSGLVRLKKLTKLKSLDLEGCKEITDDGLKHLCQLPNLESLTLDGSSIDLRELRKRLEIPEPLKEKSQLNQRLTAGTQSTQTQSESLESETSQSAASRQSSDIKEQKERKPGNRPQISTEGTAERLNEATNYQGKTP